MTGEYGGGAGRDVAAAIAECDRRGRAADDAIAAVRRPNGLTRELPVDGEMRRRIASLLRQRLAALRERDRLEARLRELRGERCSA